MTLVKAAAFGMLSLLASCGGGDGGGSSSTTPPATPAPTMLAAVSPLFPTNGAKWNDYVAGNLSTATDTACNAATDTACFHGGEVLVVVATGMTSCTGLTATDDLGAFNWVCDGTANPVELMSTGLADGKYLSDLIDFTAKAFKPNKVTVKANGVDWGVTPSTVWWTNPVVENNGGGNLAAASTVYVVTSNVMASYTLGADKVALVIQPGVILTGPGASTNVILSINHNLWLEGAIDATGDLYGVFLNLVRFSVLRNVAANNGETGIYLTGVSNSTISGVIASNNAQYGVQLDGASNNTLSGVTASNNTLGIYLLSASNNTLANVTASNNFSGIANNLSSNNALSGMTLNNNINGIQALNAQNDNTYSNVVASNNDVGIDLGNAVNLNTFSGLAASNNGTGLLLSGSSNNTFTGVLEVGSNSVDCAENGGTNPGLADVSCANNGSSDAILTVGITLSGSFVGKVASDDIRNASDTNGTAAFPLVPAAFDWKRFDNPFRSWGIDGSAFPNLDQRDRWTSGAGRIWDWSVSSGDIGNGGNPALRDVLALPTGNDTLAHVWGGTPASPDNVGCDAMVAGSVWNNVSACVTTFLRNAVEISGDGIGNDNTLCESGETCLYTPNIGSYQGHGNLVSAGTFTNGALTDITLMKYATNGR